MFRKRGKRLVSDPVGACIYCGSNEALTLEHIAPYALGGTFELPRASCKPCAKITAKFEGVVAREMLLEFRTKFKSPTRRPKERPNVLDVKGYFKETPRRITLKPEDHLAAFCLPDLSPPTIRTGRILAKGELHQEMGFWQWPHPSVIDAFSRSLPDTIDRFHIGSVSINAFVRLLAKMAHAFTTAYRGRHGFIPLLLPLILGETNEYARYVGGRSRKAPAPESGDFSFQTYTRMISGYPYVGCEIEIFPLLGAPTYDVIVGHDLKPATVSQQHEVHLFTEP